MLKLTFEFNFEVELNDGFGTPFTLEKVPSSTREQRPFGARVFRLRGEIMITITITIAIMITILETVLIVVIGFPVVEP